MYTHTRTHVYIHTSRRRHFVKDSRGWALAEGRSFLSPRTPPPPTRKLKKVFAVCFSLLSFWVDSQDRERATGSLRPFRITVRDSDAVGIKEVWCLTIVARSRTTHPGAAPSFLFPLGALFLSPNSSNRSAAAFPCYNKEIVVPLGLRGYGALCFPFSS